MPSPVLYVALNSFPKSGNTWVRAALSHLLFDGALGAIPDRYRTAARFAPTTHDAEGRKVRLYKSHDRCINAIEAFEELRHRAVIHILRHPLDCFLSQLNYYLLDQTRIADPTLRPGPSPFALRAKSVEDAAARGLLDVYLDAFICYGTLNPSFVSAGSWFAHTRYWLARGEPALPVLTLRYEDLTARGAAAMAPVTDLFGRSRAEMAAAWDKAQADTARDGAFFWRQSPGLYRELLAPAQIERFRAAHGEAVAAAGYAL